MSLMAYEMTCRTCNTHDHTYLKFKIQKNGLVKFQVYCALCDHNYSHELEYSVVNIVIKEAIAPYLKLAKAVKNVCKEGSSKDMLETALKTFKEETRSN